MTGLEYWRLRLAPLARDGYRHGVLLRDAVVLLDGDGRQIRLARPSGRWLAADLIAALGAADLASGLVEYEIAESPVRMTMTTATASRLLGMDP